MRFNFWEGRIDEMWFGLVTEKKNFLMRDFAKHSGSFFFPFEVFSQGIFGNFRILSEAVWLERNI